MAIIVSGQGYGLVTMMASRRARQGDAGIAAEMYWESISDHDWNSG